MTNALFPSVADFHPADLEARYGEHEDGQQEEAKNCNQGRGRVGTEGDQGERPPWSSAWAGTSTGRPMLRPARQPRRSLRTVFDPKRTSSPSSSITGSWLLPVVLLRLVYCHSDHARQLERAGFRLGPLLSLGAWTDSRWAAVKAEFVFNLPITGPSVAPRL